MLEKQNFKLLNQPYPFGDGRSTQVQWLMSEAYSVGMPASQRAKFDEEVQEGVDTWQKELSEAQSAVRDPITTNIRVL